MVLRRGVTCALGFLLVSALLEPRTGYAQAAPTPPEATASAAPPALAQTAPATPSIPAPSAPAGPASTPSPSPAASPDAATPTPIPTATPAPTATQTRPGAIQGVQPITEGAIAPIASIPAAGTNTAVPDDYLVSPGDVLDVQVVGLDATPRKVRVDASGVITLPLIGSVKVAGRPPRQIEVIIADMLQVKYMQDPQVSVFVDESVSQRFSIQGAVQTPNLFPLKGRMTLLQALAMSGGVTKVANLNEVRILRGTGADKQNLIFDAEKIREGELPDPQIFSNDVIIVQASAGKTVFYETLDTIRGIMSFGTVR